jgi:1-acyl-sn-glycerol-3-phosphate acyltransferase
LGFWFRLAVVVLKPLMTVFTRRVWRGQENVPRTGGVIVCVNHISYFDPLTFSHFIYDSGRLPRFLAKAKLFEIPLIGRVFRGSGQIPVYRESADAAKAFSASVEAIRAGRCVCIYPEATVTRDPALWPMAGKTGAARIALMTSAPVIPVAQWGAQDVLAPYSKKLRLWPRKTVHVVAGPPVDLSEYQAGGDSSENVRLATDKIVADITDLLAGIRHEKPPATRFDPRTSGLPTTGNPNRRDRGRAAG